MKKLILIAVPFLMMSCGSNDKQAKPVDMPQGPLSQSNNSEAFNTSFADLLSKYYNLKNAFVKEDTAAITAAATTLLKATDSLKLKELKADTLVITTATSDAESLIADLKGLLGEQGIENKRKSFNIISNILYDLFRGVRYDKDVLYFAHCPMALDNKGADWLSNNAEIVNPYLPKKMIDCGEVKDSVDYRLKK
jgi:Cu(I)/Ag(I) efflux system membrane fusion protein